MWYNFGAAIVERLNGIRVDNVLPIVEMCLEAWSLRSMAAEISAAAPAVCLLIDLRCRKSISLL